MSLVPVRPQSPAVESSTIRFRGVRVNWTDVSRITINISTPHNVAIIPVTNGTSIFNVRMVSAMTCASGTSGLGGLHNTEPGLAALTLYNLYFAYCSTTGQFGPFLAVNNTTIDAAKVAALTGGIAGTAFDYWSSCVGFVKTGAGKQFIKFENSLPGVFRYLPSTITDINVLTNGAATPGPTVVDCSGLVPYTYYGEIFGRYSADNTTNAVGTTGIYEYDGTTYIERVLLNNVDNEAGEYQTPSGYFIMGDGDGRGPNQVMYYTWPAGAPSTGLTIRVTGVRLKGF